MFEPPLEETLEERLDRQIRYIEALHEERTRYDAVRDKFIWDTLTLAILRVEHAVSVDLSVLLDEDEG